MNNSNIRVTAEEIDALINEAEINVTTVFDKCTVVSVKLKNGFVLTESSACVDKANYNLEIGTKACLERIRNKLWELEGYFLQKGVYEEIRRLEIEGKTTPKERAEQELKELVHRIDKLQHFCLCPSKKLTAAAIKLLQDQLGVMTEYANILKARLSIWEE